MYAKKSLGQHFLTSTRAFDTILDAGDVTGDDVVLEIGPGRGALTGRLLQFAGKVIAVEKDDHLVVELKETFKKEIETGKLELIHDDILNFEPALPPYKLIANIPYNITGAILEKFLSANHQPTHIVLLVQKEVAERIVAKHNKESILSLSVKAYGTPHYVETVKAGSFSPPPKVDSAIISINEISKTFFDSFTEKGFFDLLHVGFKSKRKKLSSNLSNLVGKEKVSEAFKTLDLDDNTRAEDVHREMWRQIASELLAKE